MPGRSYHKWSSVSVGTVHWGCDLVLRSRQMISLTTTASTRDFLVPIDVGVDEIGTHHRHLAERFGILRTIRRRSGLGD